MSDKKEYLKSMLTNLVHDREEEATVDFHNFLKAKMQDVVRPPEVVDTPDPINTDEE